MKRKLMGMVALCFAATFLSAAQDGKEALESFKKYLAAVKAEWDSTMSEVKKANWKLPAGNANVPMQMFDVQANSLSGALVADMSNMVARIAAVRTSMQEHSLSMPEKLDKAKKIAFWIQMDLLQRWDKLVKTNVPPELDREKKALLAQYNSFEEVLDNYIKQDVRAAPRRNADDHVADSDRAWSPVAISLFPPVQWPRADTDVMGLRINALAGAGDRRAAHHNVYGVDVGIIGNVVSNCTAGIQLAGVGNHSDTVYGFQFGGVYNVADKKLSGFQIGALNGAGKMSGFQIGAFNLALEILWKTGQSGFQIGALNGADKLSGFQIGVANFAKELSGFQIGVFNYAEKANGLQVGVLNYIEDATCSSLPLINMQF